MLCANAVLSANRLLCVKWECLCHVIKVPCSSLFVADRHQYGPTTLFLWMNTCSPTALPLYLREDSLIPAYLPGELEVCIEISKLAEIPASVDFQCGSECSPTLCFVRHCSQTNKPALEESLSVVLQIHMGTDS